MHEQKTRRSGQSDRKQVAPVHARLVNKPGVRSGVSTRKLVTATAVRREKHNG